MTQRITAAEYKARLAKAPGKAKRVKSHPVEQDLVRETLQAITLQLGVVAWRNSSGTMPAEYKGKVRYIHMSPAGSPDIFGILRGGKMFGLEGKAKTGKQTAKQKAWERMMLKLGANYAVFRSVGEAVDAVREWQRWQP